MKRITKNPYVLLAAIVFAFSVSTAAYAFSDTITTGLQSKLPTPATSSHSEPAVKDVHVTTDSAYVASIDKRILVDGIYIQPLAVYEDAGSLTLRVAYMNKVTGMEMATVLVGNETSFAGKRIILTQATPNVNVKGGYDFTFSVKDPK